MKIIADSAIPFLRGVLEPFAEVEYLPGTAISAADVRNADALVIRRPRAATPGAYCNGSARRSSTSPARRAGSPPSARWESWAWDTSDRS